MKTEATFDVEVTPESARDFARLSGDWNPLHTDAEYAQRTAFGRPVLHGAFSAGLLSRMAGMYLPGTECLLHSLRLRFLAPVLLPARLRVSGQVVQESGGQGKVDVVVTDGSTGQRYVDGGYEFGRHDAGGAPVAVPAGQPESRGVSAEPVVVVTGASGALGGAVLAALGRGGIGLSRRAGPGWVVVPDLESAGDVLGDQSISAIVHCAWPAPDNTRLIALPDPRASVEHQIAGPLRQCLALARLLQDRGTPDAILLLVGSTAADPGRHNYRSPLYSLGKALLPPLARILAVELGASDRRAVSVVFDVLEAGMNQRLSRAARQAHADRAPSGRLPGATEAASQIAWVLANRSFLLSGATLTLSGGALP